MPTAIVPSLQNKPLHQGKATRAERTQFLADVPSYQSRGTTAPYAQPRLLCNYPIMQAVLPTCLQTPTYACFQLLNYDRPPNRVFQRFFSLIWYNPKEKYLTILLCVLYLKIIFSCL